MGANSSLSRCANMTSSRSFEEVMAERIKTLDVIQAACDRIRYLIDVISIQTRSEEQWSNNGTQPKN